MYMFMQQFIFNQNGASKIIAIRTLTNWLSTNIEWQERGGKERRKRVEEGNMFPRDYFVMYF